MEVTLPLDLLPAPANLVYKVCAFPLRFTQLSQDQGLPDLSRHQKYPKGLFPDSWALPLEFVTQ